MGVQERVIGVFVPGRNRYFDTYRSTTIPVVRLMCPVGYSAL